MVLLPLVETELLNSGSCHFSRRLCQALRFGLLLRSATSWRRWLFVCPWPNWSWLWTLILRRGWLELSWRSWRETIRTRWGRTSATPSCRWGIERWILWVMRELRRRTLRRALRRTLWWSLRLLTLGWLRRTLRRLALRLRSSSRSRCLSLGWWCRTGSATKNGRVVELRRIVLLRNRGLLDPQVLHITTTEHDVFVDAVGGRNIVFRVGFSVFCAKG